MMENEYSLTQRKARHTRSAPWVVKMRIYRKRRGEYWRGREEREKGDRTAWITWRSVAVMLVRR